MTPRWLRAVRDYPRASRLRRTHRGWPLVTGDGAWRVSTGRAPHPPFRWYLRSQAHYRYRRPLFTMPDGRPVRVLP